MLFTVTVIAHNIFRWLVVLATVWALLRAYRGWLGKRAWEEADAQAGFILSLSLDFQALLGVILAFASPLVRLGFANLAGGMHIPQIRFFLAEHMPLMMIGLIVAHITGARTKKVDEDHVKHRWAALGYSLALLMTLVAIPWWRPLLRGII